nr:MAG TPA: hypothetical protein [Caudoviricetes sp.]
MADFFCSHKNISHKNNKILKSSKKYQKRY